jgi:hypothetical protein
MILNTPSVCNNLMSGACLDIKDAYNAAKTKEEENRK